IHCCSQLMACDTGSDCQNLLGCEQQTGMVMRCEQMFPKGKAPLEAVNTCVNGNCATECGGTCTGNTIGYQNPALQPCNDCFNGMCCDQFTKLTMDILNSIDPNCMQGGDATMCPPLLDLSQCEEFPMSWPCSADPDAKAAAQCEAQHCADV